MTIIYPAIFHKEENSYWTEFPDLSSCQSFGDNIKETLDNSLKALEGYAITLLEEGKALPKPTDIKSIKTDSDSFVTLIEADLSPYFNKSKAVKKTLTIPSWLNDAATEKNINFSKTLQDALLEKLELV